ncbi:MAG: Rrf2 family transcriptional regulator [Chitinophagaceae bacterium]|nr:MAG: Rrf2 family transcriptional regulator [Chitinophagaceae bacterium]
MKITSQEEYGLRVLIRIAGCNSATGLSIPQLSEEEGITSHYVAKLTRLLRMAGFINSTKGTKGGYILARPATEIIINDVLKALGGAIYSQSFKPSNDGGLELCTNSVDCTARSLWQMIQFTVDQLLNQVTLQSLVNPDKDGAARSLEAMLRPAIEKQLMKNAGFVSN